MKLYFTLLLITLNFYLSAQDNAPGKLKEVLEKSMAVYMKPGSIQQNIKYKIYGSKDREKIHESYTGKLIKHDDSYINTIDQTDFVYLKEGFLKINHQQKAMMYSPASGNKRAETPIELSKYIDSFEVKKQTASKSELYFELVPKEGIHGLGYAKVELFLSPDTYLVKRQILHYSAPMNFEKPDGTFYQDFAVMDVAFAAPSSINTIDPDKFRLDHYLYVQDESVQLAEAFGPYQLIDLSKY